ncbi:MAG TPA: hypothetical protein PK384_11870 [Candidatus Latescibacteria bacterium]|nr:hypothetical protein [Candidatus Latescibacterota bacterium]
MLENIIIPLAYISPFTILGFSVAYVGVVNFLLKSKISDKIAFLSYTISWAIAAVLGITLFGSRVPESPGSVFLITLLVPGIVFCFTHKM